MAEATDKKEETSKPSTSGRKSGRSTGGNKIDFVPGALLEARDFANNWFLSKIVEVDVEGREVLVHFQNWSSRYDEWISMDSARLRPVTNQSDKLSPSKGPRSKEFKVGEKVMAVWHNSKRYPARITKVLDEGNYEVIFYDGFSMQVKGKQMSRIPKEQAEKMEIPFTNAQEAAKVAETEGLISKEERRKRKKKIEVAELFRCYKKRPSIETNKESDGKQTSSEIKVKEEIDSLGDSSTPSVTPVPEEKKKTKVKRERTLTKDHGDTINLKDDKLPEGWEKKAKFKQSGTKSGKWDVVIIGPDGRTFRSKQEIKQYMFIRQLEHDIDQFNFRLGEDFYISRGLEVPVRARTTSKTPTTQPKKNEAEASTTAPSTPAPTEATPVTSATPADVTPAADKSQPLKTTVKSEPTTPVAAEVDTPTFTPGEDGYRCPVEDCRKLFRRENLLGMHIKHYHPALYKKLGCKFLRVEELASARTAFETEEPKPAPIAPAHPVLASILTNPPQPSPSPPPPRVRLGSERKGDKERERLADSPASDEVQNLPLSKRLSLSESHSKPSTVTPATSRPGRRKSEKRPVESPVVEEIHHECSEAEGEADTEAKHVAFDEQPIKEEPYVSMLDDIPGQKELVHCFCGSPEEDGLMIQCELCLCWQHGICLQIDSEEKVPDPYVCHFCRYPSRERVSRRYTHDQTWLKKGQLPSLKFISGCSTVPADKSLRIAHTLTAAATDLKQLLHSLKVKIDVAKNKDHPKLYLWAQPWNKKTEIEPSNNDTTGQQTSEDGKSLAVPNIPLPETPIDATDCRLNLLLHIADMQNEVDSRLEYLERLFEECESDEGLMETSHVAKMLQILLKDVITLKKMASFSWSA